MNNNDKETITVRKALCMFKQALDNVPENFYKIEPFEDKPRYRERVFCYELYHQFRLIWGEKQSENVVLHGELDKRGNKLFNKEIPDFLLHSPGNNDNNLMIIEVKLNYDEDGICKDIYTLYDFIVNHHYQNGVFLYLDNDKEFENSIKKSISKLIVDRKKSVLEKLYIVKKPAYGKKVIKKTALEFLDGDTNANSD